MWNCQFFALYRIYVKRKKEIAINKTIFESIHGNVHNNIIFFLSGEVHSSIEFVVVCVWGWELCWRHT